MISSPWSQDEDQRLREFWSAGKTVEYISDSTGRTILACKQRAHKIGLTCTPERKRLLHGGDESFMVWPDDDVSVAEFTKAWHSNSDINNIAKRYGRTSKAIKVHAYDLHLGPRHKTEYKSLGRRVETTHSYRTCRKCDVKLLVKYHFKASKSVCDECLPSDVKFRPATPADSWDPNVAIGPRR